MEGGPGMNTGEIMLLRLNLRTSKIVTLNRDKLLPPMKKEGTKIKKKTFSWVHSLFQMYFIDPEVTVPPQKPCFTLRLCASVANIHCIVIIKCCIEWLKHSMLHSYTLCTITDLYIQFNAVRWSSPSLLF